MLKIIFFFDDSFRILTHVSTLQMLNEIESWKTNINNMNSAREEAERSLEKVNCIYYY